MEVFKKTVSSYDLHTSLLKWEHWEGSTSLRTLGRSNFLVHSSMHNDYKWNFRRLVSISFLLWIHSYSPNFVSKAPFWSQRNFNVNLGPSSCRPTFSLFLNIYLWWRKKMKSLWLWKVMHLLPWNCGSYGNRAARSRPTEWPRRVLKLFRTSSGRWLEVLPWFWKTVDICILNHSKHSLNSWGWHL